MDLDEYPLEKLVDEIIRRKELHQENLCAYCKCSLDNHACKFHHEYYKYYNPDIKIDIQ